MEPATEIIIQPQPGPQTMFAECSADFAILGGKAYGGKALSLDTPIPTPTGWATMGELRVGDFVFAHDGTPTQVITTSSVQFDHPCFCVSFRNGEQIVADAEHLWLTSTALERDQAFRRRSEWRARRRATRPRRSGPNARPHLVKANHDRVQKVIPPPKLGCRTTQELYETQLNRRGRYNHRIPATKPLVLPDHVLLPLDPYLLGVWLGDGTTVTGVVSTADDEILIQYANAGYTPTKVPSGNYEYRIAHLTTILRGMGVLGNKHVPARYLRASIEQRLSLVQGLMDSDGSADAKKGSCEFTTTKRVLADGVHELLSSLGIKARIRIGTATINGRRVGTKYRIVFFTDLPVFRLTRKLTRQKRELRRSVGEHTIVSVEPIDSVPVKCIGVDHPSHCYLAGRSMIPTHNTYSLLLQPLIHINDLRFGALVFRRTYGEIMDEGGMWDEAQELYGAFGASPLKSLYAYKFPSGARVRFQHMEHEHDRFRFKGAQIPLLEFDQIEMFGWNQVSYLIGRNRSPQTPIWPYCRATANPVPEDDPVGGWLRRFIDWWIDDRGFAIPERGGVIRWYTMDGDDVVWHDKPDGLDDPMSFTFIPAGPQDNPIGLQKDPMALAKLKGLGDVDRERLLKGNWNARDSAGSVIKREWIETNLVDSVPNCERLVRCWDRAATDENEPGAVSASWTAGAKLGIGQNDFTYLSDMIRVKKSAYEVKELIKSTAEVDGQDVQIAIYQDPGAAGKAEAEDMVRALKGYHVTVLSTIPPRSKSSLPGRNAKVTYANPWASQLQGNAFKVLRAQWTHAFITEADNFDGIGTSDQIDAVSGAFHTLTSVKSGGTWGRRH